MPGCELILRAWTDAEHLVGICAVRVNDVAVAVLQIAGIIVRHVADPCTVVRPAAAVYGESISGERRIAGPVPANLPQIELAGAVGRLRRTLVGHDREPRAIGAELDGVLFRSRIDRQP